MNIHEDEYIQSVIADINSNWQEMAANELETAWHEAISYAFHHNCLTLRRLIGDYATDLILTMIFDGRIK